MTSFKNQLNEEEQSVSDSEEEIQNTSYKNANNSTTSIFTDNKLSSLIKNALKHPKIELQTKQSIDFVENHTTYLSEIMNTCSGRDKLLAIIQFSWSWYAEWIDRNNQSDSTLNKDSFINAKQISNNLSYGRKVFRLLKFSDELSNIIKYNRSNNRTTLIQDTLFYSSGICSFFYKIKHCNILLCNINFQNYFLHIYLWRSISIIFLFMCISVFDILNK